MWQIQQIQLLVKALASAKTLASATILLLLVAVSGANLQAGNRFTRKPVVTTTNQDKVWHPGVQRPVAARDYLTIPYYLDYPLGIE